MISLRVEVSLFVLSPEIEDRDEVEVATGRMILYYKKIGDELLYFVLLQL
jgi:hypothetical protein